MNSTNALGGSGLVTTSSYPEVIYELKPNLRTIFKMVPFDTNSAGLRDKEYPLKAPENSIRGVILGDSLTMGSGVEIENTYHSRLEDRFNKDNHGVNFEFINFGVGGYSLRQYLAVLKAKATLYNPDFVVVGFYPGNDYHIVQEKKYQEPYKPKEKSYQFLSSFVLNEISQLIAGVSNSLKTAPQHPTAEELDYMSTLFQDFGRYSEVHNIPIYIIYLTTKTGHVVSSNLVKDMAQINRLHFIDVSRTFDQKKLKDYAIYRSDFHPNAQANAIFAEEIYGYMVNNLQMLKADD